MGIVVNSPVATSPKTMRSLFSQILWLSLAPLDIVKPIIRSLIYDKCLWDQSVHTLLQAMPAAVSSLVSQLCLSCMQDSPSWSSFSLVSSSNFYFLPSSFLGLYFWEKMIWISFQSWPSMHDLFSASWAAMCLCINICSLQRETSLTNVEESSGLWK